MTQEKTKKIIVCILLSIFVVLIYLVWFSSDDIDDSTSTIRTGGHSVKQVEWSPDGSLVAACYDVREEDEYYSKTKVWQYENGKIQQIYCTNTSDQYSCPIAWSADGSMIAIGRIHEEKREFRASIHILNTTSWETITVLEGEFLSILSLAWSMDDSYLAASDGSPFAGDSRIIVWNTSHWSSIIIPSQPIVRILKWSPETNQLASGHQDRTIRIHDFNGVIQHVLVGHYGSVLCLDWSHDGKYLASGSHYEMILWHTNNWTIHK